ncbi:MAG: YdeI/OmpD-associated family protein [Chloroflexota bacterium]|nr:YdeI/OmpD-associated family protein [Chloroflexota bacterium]
MSVYRFEATLEKPDKQGAWTFVRIPFSVADEFGVKGQVPVKGAINGVPYENSLLPQGEGVHILVVKKEIRDRAGVDAGDVAEVTLERESGDRTVTVPPELAEALQSQPGAQQIFYDLSYSHKKAYCNHVGQARKADTRIRRASRCVELLLDSVAAGLTPGFRRSPS